MNAPVIFQIYINQILTGLINNISIIHLDNILIYWENKKDYTLYIKRIFKKLIKYKLYVKLRKYVFYAIKMEFLGFLVFKNNIRMKSNKIQTIIE